MDISVAAFGFALACFFGSTAIGSPFSGRIAERLGAAPQLAIAAVLAGSLMISLGFVSSFSVLAALLAAGGLANSLVAPAAGSILGSMVSARRLSLASGMVQAALAAPPLTAGLLVRFVTEPHGWRAAFWVGGLFVTLSALASLLARSSKNPEKERGFATAGETAPTPTLSESMGRRVLILWALGAGLATVAVTATASFFVPVATASGFSAATAGLLALAAGGLAAAVRVVVGLFADRRPYANVATVVGMILMGCVGLTVISIGTPVAFLGGALLLVMGLWGWNGLLVASTIRLLPGSSARALGSLQVGFFAGAMAAPILFGAVSAEVGFVGALLAVAASAVAGAGVVAAAELYRRRGVSDAARDGK